MVIRSLMGIGALALLLASSIVRGDEPKDARRDDAPAKTAARRGDVAEFPRGEPAELGIDKAALERLRGRARETDSDALVIVKDARLVADWDFGRDRGRIEAMSITKSIVNLAIGRLIDQGKIQSLDKPVHEFYPEWNQGRKKLITLRHLLNHTSGLQCVRNTGEIYESPDFVQFALVAELSDDPGSKFSYNNKAVNLLAGIVRRASGERLDLLIGKEIFGPLGISDFGWSLDGAGNPHVLSGLQIRAIDLARVGQMMLDEGAWNGRQLVSKEWVRRSVEPSQALDPTCGLLWWRVSGPTRYAIEEAAVKHFKDRGMTAPSVKKLEALKGKPMDRETLGTAIGTILSEDKVLKTKLRELQFEVFPLKTVVEDPDRGYAAMGSLGQYLFVIPRHRLIAVRQRRKREGTPLEETKNEFGQFLEMVAALVPDQPKR